jgi:Zn-dependent protease
MLFTIKEVIDIVIMSAGVGFIFSSTLDRYRHNYEPLEHSLRFNYKSLLFAIYATAPAIILHELAHKFTAMYFGLSAEFNAAYTWLFVGILLKIFSFPFIFFVPGYVAITGAAPPLSFAITALAGPTLNLGLWLASRQLVRKNLLVNYTNILLLTSKINMFLFIFNMLPIPGFDGYNFLNWLIKLI